jgi:ASC-1-like (ASCH) protein
MELTVENKWFIEILRGRKVIEGRVNKPKFQNLKIGDKLIIRNKDSNESVIKNIVDLKRYKSFREYLFYCGLEKTLPNIYNIEEGVNIYLSFPGFIEGEKEYGVIAIFLDD